MAISSITGTNSVQTGQAIVTSATDSISKNLQNQILNKQKQLQEISANKDMTAEEKRLERQEIQKQINDLNSQLRQRQIEIRKEQQEAIASSIDDMLGTDDVNSIDNDTGLSKESMEAIISADSSMKQAQVQGSVATEMKGRAGVLKSEIEQDAGRGIDVANKQKELSKLEQRTQNVTASQLSTLANANEKMGEAAMADDKDETRVDRMYASDGTYVDELFLSSEVDEEL